MCPFSTLCGDLRPLQKVHNFWRSKFVIEDIRAKCRPLPLLIGSIELTTSDGLAPQLWKHRQFLQCWGCCMNPVCEEAVTEMQVLWLLDYKLPTCWPSVWQHMTWGGDWHCIWVWGVCVVWSVRWLTRCRRSPAAGRKVAKGSFLVSSVQFHFLLPAIAHQSAVLLSLGEYQQQAPCPSTVGVCSL